MQDASMHGFRAHAPMPQMHHTQGSAPRGAADGASNPLTQLAHLFHGIFGAGNFQGGGRGAGMTMAPSVGNFGQRNGAGASASPPPSPDAGASREGQGSARSTYSSDRGTSTSARSTSGNERSTFSSERRGTGATRPATRIFDNPSDAGLSTYGHSGGIWLNNPNGDAAAVSRAVNAAGDKAPVFVQYSVPGRDNGGASAGGARSAQQYLRGVEANAKAIGNHNAVVVLEPDALAMGKSPQLIKQALETYKKNAPNAKVLLDAAHSQWMKGPQMANLLKSAGIDKADGFSSNVSNYHSTADEKAYGNSIRQALGPGYANLPQYIDTSRNKNGDGLNSAGRVTWGDPVRARNGPVATGLPPGTAIDAKTTALWVKPPGEADGLRFRAGQYVGTRLVQRG